MKRHRSDATQKEIIDVLRKCGVSVGIIGSGSDGIPDLVIGYRGKTFLCECKTAKEKSGWKWRYKETQIKFHADWKGGRILTFTNAKDAADWVCMMGRGNGTDRSA